MAAQRPFALVNGRWVAAPRGVAGTRELDELRVLTWNVWFGDHMFAERAAALRAELARRRPHVIALQEVTGELLEQLLDEPWLRAAYQVSDVELWQRYDVVALARVPIREVTALELPTEMGRRLIVLDLACGLAVGSVHLESMKPSSQARADQLAIIQPLLAAHGDAALVGDLNFSPADELETAALDPAFVDVWTALRPGEPGYTADGVANLMRYMLKPTGTQKRIDRVFLRGTSWRASAIELVGTAPIDGDGTFVSDHFGLEATLVRAAD
jgi:tyrosyl-DNA phosphodiesterase 2